MSEMSGAKNTRATVIPCLRYRDAPAAIEWLCQAFGFEKPFGCGEIDAGLGPA